MFFQIYSRMVIVFILTITSLFYITNCSHNQEELYHLFENPPVEARPFVRWWWNGDQVNEEEILRELDVLKKAGIGGVEINPIAMPTTAVDIGAESLEWLSPEWSNMVKAATDGAHQRGMIVDMIVGTGWPFGGRFLPPDEQIKGVVLQKIPVEGPGRFEDHTTNLIDLRRPLQDNGEVPEPEILFIRLVPREITELNDVQDLTDNVASDGTIQFEIPEGEYVIYLGSIQRGMGFREVTLGAPGADGPCLDHYNTDAVRRYLDRVSDSLAPYLGGKLGDALRALFVDSIELSGSNWTSDLLTEFRTRRGYDLEPYYQFVFYEDPYEGYQQDLSVPEKLTDTIRRVRYDYNQTLVELFLERFTETYHQWCGEQNTQSRYQAYGTPWLMGMAEGYMIPDIPESNNWLFSPNAYSHGYNVWNKYTSAGAHLTGRSIASCEAMTNTSGVFKTSLNMIKQADDMNFIMGINHAVLHGYNYSPPEAGFPGWVRFGSYFSEQNSWWPYFQHWVDYNSRLSAVFQEANPQVNIGILVPRADIWSTSGLARVPIHTTPWYAHRLWEAISQNGASADYISEQVIQDAEKAQGELRYGPMAFKTLILTDVQTLEVATIEAIHEYVETGGKVVFVGSQPHRSAGLTNAVENDRIVRETINDILNDYPIQAQMVAAPENNDVLLSWTSRMFQQADILQDVNITDPDKELYQIHSTWDGKEIFFFVNNSEERDQHFTAEFDTEEKTPWIWDPHTGERRIYPYGTSRSNLFIQLQPLESLLLIFEPHLNGVPPVKTQVDTNLVVQITGPWACDFNHTQNGSFQRTLNELADFGQSEDSLLNTFAGSIHYQTTFSLQDSLPAILDLGKVHGVTEVRLNDNPVGKVWWGRHLYDISSSVQDGVNELEVIVTTVLYNYVRSLRENATAQRWTELQETVPAGLIGPVNLYGMETEQTQPQSE